MNSVLYVLYWFFISLLFNILGLFRIGLTFFAGFYKLHTENTPKSLLYYPGIFLGTQKANVR